MKTKRPTRHRWIGVDLDGTLAYYTRGTYPRIGRPITRIQNLVKSWINHDVNVKIFTARVAHNGTPEDIKRSQKDVSVIEMWSLEHLGKVLPVTNQKDFDMIACLCDRSVQVQENTGMFVSECTGTIDIRFLQDCGLI